jgi:hypothetical protein
MKMRTSVKGATTDDLDEYAGAAIRESLANGAAGIRDVIMTSTDDLRDVGTEEHVTITEDDGTVLWSGWLDKHLTGPAPDAAESAAAGMLAALYEGTDDSAARWAAINIAEQAGVTAQSAGRPPGVPGDPVEAAPGLDAAMAETRELRSLLTEVLADFEHTVRYDLTPAMRARFAGWRQRAGIGEA